jgi:OmpA-OmpF porin, OOP family
VRERYPQSASALFRGGFAASVFVAAVIGLGGLTLAASTSRYSSAPVAQNAAQQPEMKSVKIEFVPGERAIFFDDFSDTAADEPPAHWKVRDGKVDIKSGSGMHELYAEEGVQITSPPFVVPNNFTFELVWNGNGETRWHFQNKDGNDVLVALVRGEEDGQTVNIHLDGPDGNGLGDGTFQTDTSKPVNFGLWAQQGRVRGYINGERLVDANQVEFEGINRITAEIGGYRPNGIFSVRVAESAPDFSTTISSTGKYVTHGIYFDTDSAQLKPESAAVLKQVAAGLEKNPNLKLEIDGYTDSVGEANHNLELSKRRAEAVRSVLVSQFGVDASRLTSNGLGAANPIGSNDTPDGRAQNRRVEFLKK